VPGDSTFAHTGTKIRVMSLSDHRVMTVKVSLVD